MQLVIMAAGMGSRFGGAKQTYPFGPNGEFIIDYSIFDAIRLGFDKVIFIIKEDNYNEFRDTIGSRIEKFINTEYVFQKIDNIPNFVKIPENRVKPWGTAHAIYCAKDAVTSDFVVINADDFYGYDAFLAAKEFILNKNEKEYATIGYEAAKTLTLNGSVKRGVIKVNEDGSLNTICECSIERINDKIKCKPLDSSKEFIINLDDLVSMNMLIFDISIFDFIEKKMNDFFANSNNLEEDEFLIPNVLDMAKNEGYAKVMVVSTNAIWYGVTYKEDVPYVKESIMNLINDNKYPLRLWEK